MLEPVLRRPAFRRSIQPLRSAARGRGLQRVLVLGGALAQRQALAPPGALPVPLRQQGRALGLLPSPPGPPAVRGAAAGATGLVVGAASTARAWALGRWRVAWRQRGCAASQSRLWPGRRAQRLQRGRAWLAGASRRGRGCRGISDCGRGGGAFLEKTEHWRVLRITAFYETRFHPTRPVGQPQCRGRPQCGCTGFFTPCGPGHGLRASARGSGRQPAHQRGGRPAVHPEQRHAAHRAAGPPRTHGRAHGVAARGLHGRGRWHLGRGPCAGAHDVQGLQNRGAGRFLAPRGGPGRA